MNGFNVSRVRFWDDFRTFLDVIDAGSFRSASSANGAGGRFALNTVRTRVERLERQLGTQLLIRAVEGVVPTEDGLRLAASVRQICDVIGGTIPLDDMLEEKRLIDDLRREEMWSVTLVHDNPDEGPACAIYCEGEWVQGVPNPNGLYPVKQFFGDTVLACLRAAYAEMTAWRDGGSGRGVNTRFLM